MSARLRLNEILDVGKPFAVLHRPAVDDTIEVLSGAVVNVGSTHDLETLSADQTVFAALPAHSGRERGLDVWRDDSPLAALCVDSRLSTDRRVLVEAVGCTRAPVASGDFEEGDDQYAERVRRLIRDEIAKGEGANFVLERRWSGVTSDVGPRSMLALYSLLLEAEKGAYWTFLFWTGDRYLLGSSPECHIRLRDGVIAMSPISGTLRHRKEESLTSVHQFLQDSKEDDELCMVLDEELKVVSALSDGEVIVEGPKLRRMARVSHTEYRISGRSTASAANVLRHSLAAPTVVGSPLRNAAAVVARHEGRGRGYYSGVVALFEGPRELDSAIIIRTAEISTERAVTFGVGATITRSSDPVAEASETSAKAASVLAVLDGTIDSPTLRTDGSIASRIDVDDTPTSAVVQRLLTARNDRLAPFWFGGGAFEALPTAPHVHIIDAEDEFAAMLKLQLESLGASVTRSSWRQTVPAETELLVLGPGPGDPRDPHDKRMNALHERATAALLNRLPMLAVCLGHQLVARRLGLRIRPEIGTGQGRQSIINHFGDQIRVGNYNSFSAHSSVDWFRSTFAGEVQVSRDPLNGTVHGLRGARLETFQFHPESILSPDGLATLRSALCRLTSPADQRLRRLGARS